MCPACTFENSSGPRCAICSKDLPSRAAKRRHESDSKGSSKKLASFDKAQAISAVSQKNDDALFDDIHFWLVTSENFNDEDALLLGTHGIKCGAKATVWLPEARKVVDGRNFKRVGRSMPCPPPSECQIVFAGSLQSFLKNTGWESIPDDVEIRTPEFVSESIKRGELVSDDEFVWRDDNTKNSNSSGSKASKKSMASRSLEWPVVLRMSDRELTICGLGLGTMPLCVCYPSVRPSHSDAIKLIHTALAAGVRYFDTADTYCRDQKDLHYGEILMHEALSSCSVPRSQVVVATKGGMTRMGDTSSSWRNFVSPSSLDVAIRESARVMGGSIDIWQLHHPPESAKHSLEACLEVIQKHFKEGTVKAIGICNATEAELVRASKIIDISVVQDKFSFYELKSKAKRMLEVRNVIKFCKKSGIPFVAYGVFGGTHLRQGKLQPLAVKFPGLVSIAKRLNVSVYVLALAFLKQQYFEDAKFLPIPGARHVSRITDWIAATKLRLTAEDLGAIAHIVC